MHLVWTLSKKKTNKHKQLRGIIPEMVGGQSVYVFPVFLGKKHINKIPRKSQEKAGRVPGQSREHFAYVFSGVLGSVDGRGDPKASQQ